MKLCYSTIGCPDWGFKEIFSVAKDLGYNAVEVRGISNEMYAPAIKQFKDDELDKTKAYLQSINIDIPVFVSGACLADYSKRDTAVLEAKAYIDLAQKYGSKYIRVLPTDRPFDTGNADLKLCEKQYKEVVEYGKEKGVTPLMETNGVFADTKLLKEFLDNIGDGAGALWDIHHPYRYNDEKISESIANLGSYIKHVHLKDSVIEKGSVKYKMMGYGDIPVEDAIKALIDNNYPGYYSLEWVKRWNHDLEDPGIVLSHFIYFMHRFN